MLYTNLSHAQIQEVQPTSLSLFQNWNTQILEVAADHLQNQLESAKEPGIL